MIGSRKVDPRVERHKEDQFDEERGVHQNVGQRCSNPENVATRKFTRIMIPSVDRCLGQLDGCFLVKRANL